MYCDEDKLIGLTYYIDDKGSITSIKLEKPTQSEIDVLLNKNKEDKKMSEEVLTKEEVDKLIGVCEDNCFSPFKDDRCVGCMFQHKGKCREYCKGLKRDLFDPRTDDFNSYAPTYYPDGRLTGCYCNRHTGDIISFDRYKTLGVMCAENEAHNETQNKRKDSFQNYDPLCVPGNKFSGYYINRYSKKIYEKTS